MNARFVASRIRIHHRGHPCFVLACTFGLITTNLGWAQTVGDKFDWPQFLGPQRNGISTETGLLDRWPEGGPKVVWRVRGGVGMSGLAISRGRLFTLVQKEGEQKLISLIALTGEPVWETTLAPEYRNLMGNGSRTTPAVSGELVFAYTGEGILSAVNFASGKGVWSHNVVNDLRGKVAEYGMASSPLVIDNLVIVTVGAPHATVAAYDTVSGKLAWNTGDDPAGYSSPTMLKVGGRQQLVVYSGSSVLGLQAETGTILWRYPYATNFDCNIAVPLAINDHVFISPGENQGSVLLRLEATGDKFTAYEVWKSQGPKSVFRNEWQTSVLHDGYLYGFDNVGAASPVTHLACINAVTGERAWQEMRFGKGNLILADGKLFIITTKGELIVVRATTKGYEEIGRVEVIKLNLQAPSLSKGLLYLRDNEEIVCLDVRQP